MDKPVVPNSMAQLREMSDEALDDFRQHLDKQWEQLRIARKAAAIEAERRAAASPKG